MQACAFMVNLLKENKHPRNLKKIVSFRRSWGTPSVAPHGGHLFNLLSPHGGPIDHESHLSLVYTFAFGCVGWLHCVLLQHPAAVATKGRFSRCNAMHLVGLISTFSYASAAKWPLCGACVVAMVLELVQAALSLYSRWHNRSLIWQLLWRARSGSRNFS